MSGVSLVALLLAVASMAAGCGESARSWRGDKPIGDQLEPRLPLGLADAGTPSSVSEATFPAFARYLEAEPNLEVLAEVERCAECHRDIVDMWRDSPHAHASFNNPWYRASVDAFRRDQGHHASRFCAGCHDPLLLASGAMDHDVGAQHPLANAGVSCMICHGISEASSDGRASYTLRSDPIPYPLPDDEASLRAHRARMASPALRTVTLCGSCHRAHLDGSTGNPHFLPGMDDLGAYSGSSYAGSHGGRVDPDARSEDCSSCHMERVPATRDGPFARTGAAASHRFPGGQTSLAAQRSRAQLQATQELLKDAAIIEFGAVRSEAGDVATAPIAEVVQPGETVTLDLLIYNQSAGHRFPGGVRDTQDSWLEVTAVDQHGCLLGEHGTFHERAFQERAFQERAFQEQTFQEAFREQTFQEQASPAVATVPTAHQLSTVFVDEEGVPELLHRVDRFRSMVYDHTVAPRDARAVRYRLHLQDSTAFPVTVTARLRHRRHNRLFQEFVCEAQRSPRGQQFRRPGAFDGCRQQPVTELATAQLILIAAGTTPPLPRGRDHRPRWQRLYLHALALSHQLSEYLVEASAVLEEASELADTPSARAQIAALRATVEGRQGRLPEALFYADESERRIRQLAHGSGERPVGLAAVFRARGVAFSQVWKFSEAVDAFREVLRLSPRDTRAYADLARSLGSLGRRKEALRVAREGLRLSPRHAQLLRSQAMALAGLESPYAEAARNAFLSHREPDLESELRQRCIQQSEVCRTAIVPVPTFALHPSDGSSTSTVEPSCATNR